MPSCDIPIQWCSNGTFQTWVCLNKGSTESDTAFAERAGKELTAALKAHHLTDDC